MHKLRFAVDDVCLAQRERSFFGEDQKLCCISEETPYIHLGEKSRKKATYKFYRISLIQMIAKDARLKEPAAASLNSVRAFALYYYRD